MASRNHHLDATTDREVVYCHRCEHEWYRDDRSASLACPRCHSDITEIVSLDNDPRTMNDSDSLSDIERDRLRHFHDDDSDPDEADIEEHITEGPGGFYARRTVFRSPERRSPGNRTRPDNGEDIIRRFTEMLGEMGGPVMVGRSGPDTLFSNSPPRVRYQRISGPGFTGGFGSFNITTAPSPGPGSSPGPGRSQEPGGSGARLGSDDPFQRVFGDIILNVGPPPIVQNDPHAPNPNGGEGGAGRPRDLTIALNQLLGMFLNPHAVHGDAVYSQEALDRIITNLMEANPQSNAAAPASAETIAKLPKKKLNEEMLGPELKGECTICIDEVKLADEAVVLPCKHWFHETCVVLWLKQHNTCPICRAPVDGDRAGQPAEMPPQNSQPGPSTASSSSSSTPGPSDRRRSYLRQRGEARLDSIRELANINDRRQGSRRDSNSPPMYSPPGQSPRVRTPSPSSHRSSQSERAPDGNRGSSSTGPFNWLRDQFRGDRRS
ncbi:hypothetical protein F4779DRAFT_475932 [Xylariaceae sp. FL0662B]|nr:hypothetical protein F4779DRAFT_475932 [Xylariaceae sp. FL0662B]